MIASDFYHSNELMPLSDEAIINRVVSNMGACEPAFLGAQVSTAGKTLVQSFGCGSVRLQQTMSAALWWVLLEDVALHCRGCTRLVSSLAAVGSTDQYCQSLLTCQCKTCWCRFVGRGESLEGTDLAWACQQSRGP